jgi:hypothetical protein
MERPGVDTFAKLVAADSKEEGRKAVTGVAKASAGTHEVNQCADGGWAGLHDYLNLAGYVLCVSPRDSVNNKFGAYRRPLRRRARTTPPPGMANEKGVHMTSERGRVLVSSRACHAARL